jgi:hypothetical protein
MPEEQDFKSASVTQGQYNQDSDALKEIERKLNRLENNYEALPPAERAKAIAEEVLKALEIVNRYDKPENQHLLAGLVSDSGFDMAVFEKAINRYELLAEQIEVYAKNDPDNPSRGILTNELEDKIDHIKELFDSTRNMEGLTDDQKLARYDACIAAVVDMMLPISARKDEAGLNDYITRRVGMHPDHLFPDKGMEYVQLSANKFRDLVEKAENYTMEEAAAELKRERGGNPSHVDIHEYYLEQRLARYQQADQYYDRLRNNLFLDGEDLNQVQILAKTTPQHVRREVEVTQRELENLRNSADYAKENPQAKNETASVGPDVAAGAENNRDFNAGAPRLG